MADINWNTNKAIELDGRQTDVSPYAKSLGERCLSEVHAEREKRRPETSTIQPEPILLNFELSALQKCVANGRVALEEKYDNEKADKVLLDLNQRLEKSAAMTTNRRLTVMPMDPMFLSERSITSLTKGDGRVLNALDRARVHYQVVPGNRLSEADKQGLPVAVSEKHRFFLVADW